GETLRGKLNLLPALAERGLCDTAKDISMGGILGTTLMLLETSKVGACLWLDQLPVPPGLTLETWLISFPSYGFILSVRPGQIAPIQRLAGALNLVCAEIGDVTPGTALVLRDGVATVPFWDLATEPLMGW
ncbi:MAG: putative thiamine-monophosphate kinase, partial [Cyanobacteriota bacterium]